MKRPSIIEEIEKEEDGSCVGWLPGGWGAIGAVPRPVNQLSKRHQSTRTRTKIRDRGQLRRTRFQRGGIESATDPTRSSPALVLIPLVLAERC